MPVEVHWDDQQILIESSELEEDICQGRIPPHASLRLEGQPHFIPLLQLPALHLATEHPTARMMAFMRQSRWPIISTILLFAMGLVFLCLDPWTAATGWEALRVDGRFWTVWTAPLAHVRLNHLLGNLPILLYCAYRSERALGPSSAALIGASAIAGGSLMVGLGAGAPVVGASVMAWGYCAAQILIGLRFMSSIPPAQHRYYAGGNVALALPLFLSGLGADGVSHLMHLGGLVGGGLATLLLSPESRTASASFLKRRRYNLGLAGFLLLAPSLLALQAPHLQATALPEVGMQLDLPVEMKAARLAGLPAFFSGPQHDQGIFVELATLSGPHDAQWEWEHRLNTQMTPQPAPPPLGLHWTAQAWLIQWHDAPYQLVEYSYQSGEIRRRIGFIAQNHARPQRLELYQRILNSVVLTETPDVRATREAWEESPESPALRYAYARELLHVGDQTQAHLLLQPLQHDPQWAEAVGSLTLLP